jgi:hypothetical protein
VAVPLAASVNAVVQHLAADTAVGEGATPETDERSEGVVGDTEDAPTDDADSPPHDAGESRAGEGAPEA